MRAFKFFTLVGIVIWLGAIVANTWFQAYQRKSYFLAAQQLLFEATSIPTGRRIFLVGSSPVFVGLSASTIQESTGLPTTNMGGFSGRTLFDGYFEFILNHIRPNDIVVLSDPRWIDTKFEEWPARCFERQSFSCVSRYLTPFPAIVGIVRELWSMRKSNADPFRTAQGDYVFSRKDSQTAENPRVAKGKTVPVGFSRMSVEKIKEQVHGITIRGACAIVVLPPFLVDQDSKLAWEHEYSKLFENLIGAGLHEHVLDSRILVAERRFFIRDNYHPSELGRANWTSHVLQQLSQRHQCGIMVKDGTRAAR